MVDALPPLSSPVPALPVPWHLIPDNLPPPKAGQVRLLPPGMAPHQPPRIWPANSHAVSPPLSARSPAPRHPAYPAIESIPVRYRLRLPDPADSKTTAAVARTKAALAPPPPSHSRGPQRTPPPPQASPGPHVRFPQPKGPRTGFVFQSRHPAVPVSD